MYSMLERTFHGLSREYYVRQFLFGLIIPSVIVRVFIEYPTHLPFWMICLLVVNSLLYPYARFAFDCIAGFLFGRMVVAVPLLVLLVAKAGIMALCWGCAIFIAPVTLACLYVSQGRGDPARWQTPYGSNAKGRPE